MRQGLIYEDGQYVVPCMYRILPGEGESLFGGEEGYYIVCDDTDGLLCGYYDMKYHYFCVPKYADVDISLRNDENIISVSDALTHFRGYIYAETEERIGEFIYVETGPFHHGAVIADGLEG